MATEADLIQKFKDLNIPVGADFEELIHEAFVGANLVDKVDNHDSRIATLENDLSATKGSVQAKVTDNKDGTEQLNGTKVQPFNKLSDSVGGRNYLLKSDQPITVSDGGTNNRLAIIPTSLKTLSAGTYIFTADVSGLVGNQTSLSIGLTNPNNFNDNYARTIPIIDGTVTEKTTVADGDIHTSIIIYSGPDTWKGSAGCTAIHTNYQLIKSDVVKDWTPAPEDKADDSKVVHKTGDEEISGSKTFDTAPIDKTTGNPYITKDGVSPTLADTTKDANFTGKLQKSGIDVATKSDVTTAVSTATANMVDSTKSTNFTAGLKSGGVDVATAADLKSVADKAWHMKSLPDVPALKNISLLYQVDDTNKKMNIVLNGSYSSATAEDSTGLLIADLSDIIQGITAISMKENTNKSGFYYYDRSMQQMPDESSQVNIVFSGTKLYMNTGSTSRPILRISEADYLCLMYGSTISYTKLA